MRRDWLCRIGLHRWGAWSAEAYRDHQGCLYQQRFCQHCRQFGWRFVREEPTDAS